MLETLKPWLPTLTAASWPATPAAMGAVLAQLGYHRVRTVTTHEHWELGDRLATVCHEPALDVTFLEAVLTMVEVPDDDTAAYERAHKEVAGRYRTLLADLEGVLGAPDFEGAFDDEGFPEDEDAVRLAAWCRDGVACYLQFRDDGPIAPVRVALVLTPLTEA